MNPSGVILLDLSLDDVFVLIIEDGNNQVHDQVNTTGKEKDEVKHRGIVPLVVREDDIWEVRCCEQYVDIESCILKGDPIAILIIVLRGVKEQCESEQCEQDDVGDEQQKNGETVE